MDGLRVFLLFLLGVVSCSHDLEVTVRPGNNITLNCDCKSSSGVYIVWYRNCSHENQPSLVLKTNTDEWKTKIASDATDFSQPIPRFHFVKNVSSNSYDLLIMNITDSDEGLYYCGTEQTKVEDEHKITQTYIHTYGNITTRITVDSSKLPFLVKQDCRECWTLLFSLCPALSVLSSVVSSLLVYHCWKGANKPEADEKIPTRGQTRGDQDEDVCYAALEIRQTSQRPRKKKTQSSDFSTYSAINTSRM